MKNQYTPAHWQKITGAIIGVVALGMLMTACNRSNSTVTTNTQVKAGLASIAVIDAMLKKNIVHRLPRSGALMGVYISEYISSAILHPVHAAIAGVHAQEVITEKTSVGNTNADFALLQTFGEQLSVDVSGLLNRSQDRQKALDMYLMTLTATGKSANDRYTILQTQLKDLQTQKRDADKVNNALKKDVQKAITAKDFTLAGEKQSLQSESEKNLSEINTNLIKTQNIVKSFDTLLTLYGERTIAISKNRELLISGLKAVDIPGVDSLNIIQHEKAVKTRTSTAGGGSYNFFNFGNQLNGL